MQRGKAFWKGSVRIRVTGREPERFFNLCGHHNITLWDVTEHKGCFDMSLLPEDFFRLLPIRRKSGVRIRIQKKQGLPFFYRRSLKRKAFFIGIFLCLAGLYTLSQFIWNIHVEGNYANSTQTILNSLDAAGIHHGSWKKRVDCSQTASYLQSGQLHLCGRKHRFSEFHPEYIWHGGFHVVSGAENVLELFPPTVPPVPEGQSDTAADSQIAA